MQNPYHPPKTDQPGAPTQPPPQQAGPGVCPSCHSGDYKALKFTWWGGALGPKLFNHVKCNHCGTTFNAKTGKSNNTAIAIYSVVVTAIVIAVVVGLRMT